MAAITATNGQILERGSTTMATSTKKAGSKTVAAKKTAAKTSSTAKVKPTAKKATTTKSAIAKKPVVKTAAKKATAAKPKATKAAKPVAKASPKAAAKKAPAKKPATVSKTTSKPKPAAKPVAKAKTVAVKATAPKTTKKPPVVKEKISKPIARKPAVRTQAVTSSSTEFDLSQIPSYREKKGEEYMNDAQRLHIEKILLSWRDSLMANSEDTMSHLKDEAANFPDPSDRASQEEEFSIELRTRDRERKLLKKIEQTLDLLRSEDFGYCEACGVEIGIRRLEARPTATLCIDCKTLAELKEKQTVGN